MLCDFCILYFILGSDRKTVSTESFGKQEEGWNIDEWNDTDKGKESIYIEVVMTRNHLFHQDLDLHLSGV